MAKTEMKTVNIKGKEYVTVNERVKAFHELYPNGSLVSTLVSAPESNRIVFKAVATPDIEKPERRFVGFASESIGDGFINKASAMENAETSAYGRCLGFANIGIVDSIASVDEINKANVASKNPGLNRPTDEQRRTVASLMSELNLHSSPDDNKEWSEFCIEAIGVPNPLNQEQAMQLIEYMQEKVMDNK